MGHFKKPVWLPGGHFFSTILNLTLIFTNLISSHFPREVTAFNNTSRIIFSLHSSYSLIYIRMTIRICGRGLVSAGSLYSSWSPGNSAGFNDDFHRNQNVTAEIRRWVLEEFSLFGLQDLIWHEPLFPPRN